MAGSENPKESTRQWVSGLAVLITTIVCLYSFARISLWAVAAAAAATLIGSLILSWAIGRRIRHRRGD